MPEVFGTATTFTIRELTGDRRTLTLAGRALPYRPVPFSGSQRAEFTWYPGNPHATVQVLGAAEDPSNFRGQWKNRFLRNVSFGGLPVIPTAIALRDNVALTDVAELAQFVDDIRRKGPLVEVTWRHLKRQGILMQFFQTWGEPVGEDLAWEMNFTWISQGDEASPAVISSRMDLGDVQGSWQIVAAAVTTARANPPFEQPRVFRERADNIVASIGASADEVVGAVSNVVVGATSSQDGVRRLASVMDSVNQQAQALRAEVSNETAESERFNLPAAPGAPPSFSSRLRANIYSRGLYDSAREAQKQANLQRDDFVRKLNPQLIAAFVAREGQNLRDVARAFYGTQDEWGVLLDFNNFQSSRLSAGQVVFVPKQDSVGA